MSTVVVPGDLKFAQVSIDDKDYTQFALVTHIFQDIFTPFWTAEIGFVDSQNLIMNAPIQPGSKVDIVLETDGPKPCTGRKKFTFYIYKIAERTLQKQETQTYMLHCISEGFFTNQKTRIQKAFKRMTPKDLVGEFVSGMDGSLTDADDDPTKYDLIIPNWSPVAACEWVSRFAKNPNGGADFLLFQSDDGKYKFKSIEKMFKDRSGLVLKQMQPNLRSNPHQEEEDAFINIEHYEFIKHHDSITNFQVGYYANTTITHDIVNKTITTTPFTYGDDIPADASKPPFSGELFEGAELTNISFYPTHPGIMEGLTPEETQITWYGSRKTNLLKLEENRLVIQVPGFVCGWQWLGKSCNIELPSHQDLDENMIYDRLFKGEYLITAIKHHYSKGRYMLIMELGKKRLNEKY